MKPSPSSQHDEQDREIINLLEELGAIKSAYPSELLTVRREAFLARVDQLTVTDIQEEGTVEEEEIVHLLGYVGSVQAEYPPMLRSARRSALLQQLEQVEALSPWSRLRVSLQKLLQNNAPVAVPRLGFPRISLVIGSLIFMAFLGSLLFSRMEQAFQPSLLTGNSTPTSVSTNFPPAGTGGIAILICKPEDPALSCAPDDLVPIDDLAAPGNGAAQPAVSDGKSHEAAYVNDGRADTSWVSTSPESWIKIDLGQVRTINTVSLQNGATGASDEETLGQFAIAVALSDNYADGDSSHDYTEYAQVFRSEQTGFSGSVSQAETIRTQFSPIQARYVKITFEKAGATIEEVGVFMLEPPELTEQPTQAVSEITWTTVPTNTISLVNTMTSAPTDTGLPTRTAVSTSTDVATLASTPTLVPTNTRPPADTATPVPTQPAPSDTPIPSPTAAPPTPIPPTVSTEPIIVTGSNQILVFTCNGNDAEVRGHANTVTLLGSCNSITVKGNGNLVLWQFGSPVITNKGNDNIIRQL